MIKLILLAFQLIPLIVIVLGTMCVVELVVNVLFKLPNTIRGNILAIVIGIVSLITISILILTSALWICTMNVTEYMILCILSTILLIFIIVGYAVYKHKKGMRW